MDSVVPPSQRWYYDEWHLSPLIRHDGFAFLSGVTGSRPDGSCADDPETEFDEAFEKLAGPGASVEIRAICRTSAD